MVLAWNTARAQKGTGCADLQVSSWAQRGLLASQVLKASKEVRKTTPSPTRLQVLPSSGLHFIVEK